MGVRELWIDLDCPSNQGERFLQAAAILPDQTKQIQRFRVIRVCAEYFLVKLLRVVEVSRRMACNRRVEQGIDVKIL